MFNLFQLILMKAVLGSFVMLQLDFWIRIWSGSGSSLDAESHWLAPCFQFPKIFQPYGVVSQFLTAIGQNFSVFISRHSPRDFQCQILSVPKYFGDLFSLWKVQQAGIKSTTSSAGIPGSIQATPTYELTTQITKKMKKLGIFAEQTRKWKIPAYWPNYFSEQKGVQEKCLNMVVKINPVYWLKRNQHMTGKKNSGQ